MVADAEVDRIYHMAACGNAEAATFLRTACHLAHFWDDLIDHDRSVPDAEVHDAMWAAMVTLPRNRFYRANFDDLNPVLCVAVTNWRAANEMERTDSDDDKRIAFIIRSSYMDLITHTALLCGGQDHARQVALVARRACHGETYDGYRAALTEQFVAAKRAGDR